MTQTSDDVALANQVVGPVRREQLIAAQTDRLIADGMARLNARNYAESLWDHGDSTVLLAVGQVWESRTGKDPRGEVVELLGGKDSSRFEVTAVHRNTGMVASGGIQVNYVSGNYFTRQYRLVAWPGEYIPDSPEPEPAAARPGAEDDGEDQDEERFDPRTLFVMVKPKIRPGAERPPLERWTEQWLPMLGTGYTTRYGKSGRTAWVSIDLVTYLRENLANYRDGWQHWHDTEWAPAATKGVPCYDEDGKDSGFRVARSMAYFNEFGGCDTVPYAAAAWLGVWLHDAIAGDAAREHGGRATDYEVSFSWSANMADAVAEWVPGIDPSEELPADHPLMQCAGQESFL